MISAKYKTRCGFVVVPRQRALERGSEGSSGAKGKGAAALRGLFDSSIAVLPGNVNRSISNADPDDFQQIRP